MIPQLEVYSEYSVRYGMCRIKEIISKCQEDGVTHCAITDYQNVFAWVKFYQAAKKANINAICATRINIVSSQSHEIIFYCINKNGYHNLLKLISKIYTNTTTHDGLSMETLAQCSLDGLALSLLPSHRAIDHNFVTKFKKLAPKFCFMSIHGYQVGYQAKSIRAWIECANKNQIPLLATRPVYFINKSDFQAHEVRRAINDGVTMQAPDRQVGTEDHHWHNQVSLDDYFKYMPIAKENAIKLAKMCHLTMDNDEYYLPKIKSLGTKSSDNHLKDVSHTGLEKRLADDNIKPENHKEYRERLDWELHTISQMGFPDYFLIVADFIQWAKQNNIPVGPGRGSGAGSLVAYSLGITDINPLDYQLLFERFLNPERVSMPDFDIDFCMNRRDEVIDYVSRTYGTQNVSQIITFGTMAAKGVVRDVGRVLGHPYGFVDHIARLIPFELGMTIDKALKDEPALMQKYNDEPQVQALIEMSRKLEGIVRNVGRHAGGVVIAPKPLTEFTAIYQDQHEQNIVSQFDKDDIEKIGLVKFDFLGLRTLTIVQWAIENVALKGEKIDILKINLNDKKVYETLSQGSTTGVFQVESTGMKDLLRRLKPDSFEDIIALVALYRPGPLQSGMVDDFIDRKHGRSQVSYPHPLLEDILQPTYGVILYQEQVMQIAQKLAGYTLGHADLLRRAMGKKKIEEMQAQRATFIAGCEKNRIDANVASHLFDLIEKFAGYGFNKSHSAAYALLTYQTAWLKTFHPEAFMAAVLSSDMDNTDKVVQFIEETQRMQIKLLPPSINESSNYFTVPEAGAIRYGLVAIKGIGDGLAKAIKKEAKNGPYQDPIDFLQRLHHHKCNKRSLEFLIKSGACDNWHKNRGVLYASIERIFAEYETWAKNPLQQDLFGNETSSHDWRVDAPWENSEKLQSEKEVLGWYMSEHPMRSISSYMKSLKMQSLESTGHWKNNSWIVGIVHNVRRITTKSGQRGAIIQLEDQTGRQELAVFAEAYQRSQEILDSAHMVMLQLQIRSTPDGGQRISCKQLLRLEDYMRRFPPSIHIRVHQDKLCEKLNGLIQKKSNGNSSLTVTLTTESHTLTWKKTAWLTVCPSWLEQISGIDNIEVTLKPMM